MIRRHEDEIPIVAAIHDPPALPARGLSGAGLDAAARDGMSADPCQARNGDGSSPDAVLPAHGDRARAQRELAVRASGGPTLIIETQLDPDREIEPTEALARALAAALGWEMDLSARAG